MKELKINEQNNTRMMSKKIYLDEFIKVTRDEYYYNFKLSLNDQRLLYFIFIHHQIIKGNKIKLIEYVQKLKDYNITSNEIYKNIKTRINDFQKLKMYDTEKFIPVFEKIEYKDRVIEYKLNRNFSETVFPPKKGNSKNSYKQIPYYVLMGSRTRYELNAYRWLLYLHNSKTLEPNKKMIYPNEYYPTLGIDFGTYPSQVKKILSSIKNSEVLCNDFEFDIEFQKKGILIIRECRKKRKVRLNSSVRDIFEKIYESGAISVVHRDELEKVKFKCPKYSEYRKLVTTLSNKIPIVDLISPFITNCKSIKHNNETITAEELDEIMVILKNEEKYREFCKKIYTKIYNEVLKKEEEKE